MMFSFTGKVRLVKDGFCFGQLTLNVLNANSTVHRDADMSAPGKRLEGAEFTSARKL
jgi:hypothetical protein